MNLLKLKGGDNMSRSDFCSFCGGSGRSSDGLTCPGCGGTGRG